MQGLVGRGNAVGARRSRVCELGMPVWSKHDILEQHVCSFAREYMEIFGVRGTVILQAGQGRFRLPLQSLFFKGVNSKSKS